MRFRAPAAAGTAALVFACMAPAGASAASTTYATPTITQLSSGLGPSSEPISIAPGPEQTLWLGLHGWGALDRSTLQGGNSTYWTLDGEGVQAVTEGPEGEVWFIEYGGGAQVGKVEPGSGLVTEYARPSGSKLSGLAFGPEHELWFVGEKGSEATLWRMDPATGTFDGEYKVPDAGAQPSQLTFGSEGDIWFTESANPGDLGGFEPGTDVFAQFPTTTANSDPTGIAAGPDGDIYFTEADAAAIGRFDPMTHEIGELTSGLAGAKPEQIVRGADGALYFTDSTGAVGRVTREGLISEFKSGLAHTEPWGIASGPDGNVWFTERNNPARIGRLTLPPGAACASAEHVVSTSATLVGGVASRAQETSYLFDYGTSSAYGSQSTLATLSPEPWPVGVSASVSGLSPSTTYHYRLVATNSTGTFYGNDCTFTTGAPEESSPPAPSTPPPTITPTPVAAPLPVTTQGKEAGVSPSSGTVLVQNSAGQFVALTGRQVVPIGAVIEATHGTVKLITALPKNGGTQTVKVWGGRFKIAQSNKGSGLTKIILAGALPSCPRRGAAHTASKGAKGKQRKLWAEDNHGRYSTYGANSVATVLGTEWETTDTCAGTLTRVLKGKVKVRNTHTGKTVLVTKGHSYLARS